MKGRDRGGRERAPRKEGWLASYRAGRREGAVGGANVSDLRCGSEAHGPVTGVWISLWRARGIGAMGMAGSCGRGAWAAADTHHSVQWPTVARATGRLSEDLLTEDSLTGRVCCTLRGSRSLSQTGRPRACREALAAKGRGRGRVAADQLCCVAPAKREVWRRGTNALRCRRERQRPRHAVRARRLPRRGCSAASRRSLLLLRPPLWRRRASSRGACASTRRACRRWPRCWPRC